MADQSSEKPGKSTASSDLANLLNQKLGGSSLVTASQLSTPPPPRKPRSAQDPHSGVRRAHPEGEVFVHTELFGSETVHGNFPLSRLNSIPSPLLLGCGCGEVGSFEALTFLDTETTGVGPSAVAFLVGLGRWIPGVGFRVNQFFLERGSSERALLDAVRGEAGPGAALVTYNGACFDMPLLKARCEANELGGELSALAHFDLLPPARALWKRRTGNCRLTTLEAKLLSFERVGDVEGRFIPGVYREYERFGRSERMEAVFFHNALDILSLACLFALRHEAVQAVRESRAAPAKRGKKELKAEVGDRISREDHAGALELLRCAMESDFSGDPYPFLEAASLLEKVFGEAQEAQAVLERALSSPRIPKDRAAIEKRLEKLRKRLAPVCEP